MLYYFSVSSWLLEESNWATQSQMFNPKNVQLDRSAASSSGINLSVSCRPRAMLLTWLQTTHVFNLAFLTREQSNWLIAVTRFGSVLSQLERKLPHIRLCRGISAYR